MPYLKRVFLCLLSALLLFCAVPVLPASAAETDTAYEEAPAAETDPADTSSAAEADSSADVSSPETEDEQLRAVALYEDNIDDESFWDTYHEEFADDAEYIKWYEYYNGESEEEDIRALDDETLSAETVKASSPFIGNVYVHADSKEGLSISNGIDVSKWQGTIDWTEVKAAGVEFVFIRCGYTGTAADSDLTKKEDEKFESYIEGAYNAGIQVGVYYFSQALDEDEAQEEADMTLSIIEDYQSMITLPVVCDYESAARIKGIKKTQGTKNVLAFCERIASAGYDAYYYGNPDDLKTICDYTKLTDYGCWLANYTSETEFTGDYDYWQYTSSGTVDGISGNVDCNFWYQEQAGDTYSLTAPVLSGVSSVDSAVKFTWKAVSGAEKYQVLRKTESGSWKKLKNTTATSCKDKSVSNNTIYYYTVRCVSSDGEEYTSSYNANGLCIRYLTAPVLSSISATSSKVKLKWEEVSGAVKYRVFRKTSGGSWTKLTDTTSLSYTDSEDISAGTEYTYTVRCVSADGKSYTSWYDADGLSICCAKTPSLSSISNKSSGVQIKWASAKGAELYRVFRQNSSGGWSSLGYTTSTSFTDKTVENGTSYTYTVRCVSADKKYYTSGYDSDGLTIRFLSAPKLSSVSSKSSKSVTVKWGKNSKASGYQISYTVGSTTKKVTISSGSTVSKTITGLKSGKTYKICVRAKKGSTYSAWSSSKSVTVQ